MNDMTDARKQAEDAIKALNDNANYGDAGQFYPGLTQIEVALSDLLVRNKELEEANEFFRDSPNLAFYVRALEDRKKVLRFEAILEKLQQDASLGDLSGGHAVFLEGSGEYSGVRAAEDALQDLYAEFPQWAPFGLTDEALEARGFSADDIAKYRAINAKHERTPE